MPTVFYRTKNARERVPEPNRVTEGASQQIGNRKQNSARNKENREKTEQEGEYSRLNPMKKVRSIYLAPNSRKTHLGLGQSRLKTGAKVQIELVTTSVFLGYNQIRSLHGLDSILDQVD